MREFLPTSQTSPIFLKSRVLKVYKQQTMKPTTDKEVYDRLVARGVENLSDAELLSLVLGPKKGEESVQTAEALLEGAGSLVGLSQMTLAELRRSEGIGMERAMRVAAALEIGRRVLVAEGEEASYVRDRNDVTSLMAPIIASLDHEELWVVYLASSNRVLDKRRISVGGTTSLIADCKLILRHALNIVATAIIVVHNHPSGAAEPSGEDEAFTARLQEAAALFDVRLLDHIIIARGGGSYSFRSSGKI